MIKEKDESSFHAEYYTIIFSFKSLEVKTGKIMPGYISFHDNKQKKCFSNPENRMTFMFIVILNLLNEIAQWRTTYLFILNIWICIIFQ